MIKFTNNSPDILIVRFGSLGDIVKSSVLPRLLKARYPESTIMFITKSEYRNLIEHNPYIDRKIYFEKKSCLIEIRNLLTLRKLLKKENFTVVIDAHSNLRSLFLTLFFRASFLTRYHKPRIRRFLLFFLNINLMTTRKTREGEFAKLLKPLGIINDFQGSDLFFGDSERDMISLIKTLALNSGEYVCLVPGAAWSGKVLKTAFHEKLIEKILAKNSSIKIVLLGGKKEIELNRSLSGPGCLDLTNKLSLLEAIFVASKAKLTIGGDTGLIHATEAAGGKIAIFLGPTSKETGAYPSKSGSMVFERDLFCRPCSKNGSTPCLWNLGRRNCLTFDPDEVFNKISTFI